MPVIWDGSIVTMSGMLADVKVLTVPGLLGAAAAVTKTLLPATQNAQVKDLETKVAPAFVAHRDRAQSLLNEQK